MQVRNIAAKLTTTLGLGTKPVALALAEYAPACGSPDLRGGSPLCLHVLEARTIGGLLRHRGATLPLPGRHNGHGVRHARRREDRVDGVSERDGRRRIPGRRRSTQDSHPSTQSAGVVYGPLQDFPITPDAILLWLTPRQAMLMSEASGACSWTGATPAATLGRPACAAIPTAVARGAMATSLGCVGMRTYTEVADDQMLAVIPAGAVPQLETALSDIAVANRALAEFHEGERRAPRRADARTYCTDTTPSMPGCSVQL